MFSNLIKVLVLLFFVSISLFANEEAIIKEIRKEFSQIVKRKDLYQTTVNINANKLPAPAVGVYSELIKFYWEWVGGEPYILRRVYIKKNVASSTQSNEFLFDKKGNLVFAFISGGDENIQKRYYFNNSTLIRYMENQIVFDKPTLKHIQNSSLLINQATKLMSAFGNL